MTNNRLKEKSLFEQEKTKRPVVVSAFSGKGGVGKSVVIYNVGAITAKNGFKALVIDCDWIFGNIHILANIIPVFTLGDVIRNEVSVSEAIIRLNENLDLLSSPAAGTAESELSSEDLYRFISNLPTILGDYDFIFVDTATGDLETITTVSKISDVNLIMINPELTSIADGYGLFKRLVRIDKEIQAFIFVNRVTSESDHAFIYQKFTALAHQFLNIAPLNAGFLMDNREVIDSVSHQRNLVDMEEGSIAVEQLTKLFNLLTKEGQLTLKTSRIARKESIKSIRKLADIRE